MIPNPEGSPASPAEGATHRATQPAPGVGPRYDELAGHMARARRMRADAAAELAGGLIALLRRPRRGRATGPAGRDRGATCMGVDAPAGSRA